MPTVLFTINKKTASIAFHFILWLWEQGDTMALFGAWLCMRSECADALRVWMETFPAVSHAWPGQGCAWAAHSSGLTTEVLPQSGAGTGLSSAFSLWFLSHQKATVTWTSACSYGCSVGQVMSVVQRPHGEIPCVLKERLAEEDEHSLDLTARETHSRRRHTQNNFLGRQWKPQPWSICHILPDFSVSIHEYGSVKLFSKKVSISKPKEQHDFQKQLGSLKGNFPRKFNQVFKVWLSYKLLNMRS